MLDTLFYLLLALAIAIMAYKLMRKNPSRPEPTPMPKPSPRDPGDDWLVQVFVGDTLVLEDRFARVNSDNREEIERDAVLCATVLYGELSPENKAAGNVIFVVKSPGYKFAFAPEVSDSGMSFRWLIK